MPRFTRSKDGIPRCTIRLRIRLDQEEYDLLKAYCEAAETPNVGSVRSLMETEADLAIEDLITRIDTTGSHC